MTQHIVDALMDIAWGEIEKAGAEMSQGQFYLAMKRIEATRSELVSFQRNLINMAKEWNDPRAEKWESELKKSLYFPFGFSAHGHSPHDEKSPS